MEKQGEGMEKAGMPGKASEQRRQQRKAAVGGFLNKIKFRKAHTYARCLCREINVPYQMSGYAQLLDAIVLVSERPELARYPKKELYQILMKGDSEVTRVETMEHRIQMIVTETANRIRPSVYEKYFSECASEKKGYYFTTKQFLTIMGDLVSKHMTDEEERKKKEEIL